MELLLAEAFAEGAAARYLGASGDWWNFEPSCQEVPAVIRGVQGPELHKVTESAWLALAVTTPYEGTETAAVTLLLFSFGCTRACQSVLALQSVNAESVLGICTFKGVPPLTAASSGHREGAAGAPPARRAAARRPLERRRLNAISTHYIEC